MPDQFDESYDVKLARLDEQMRQLREANKEAKEKAELAERTIATLRIELDRQKDRYARIVTREDQFTPEQARKILRILDTVEDENEDSKAFSRALKTSIATMVVSVLLFSVLVPVVQHFLVR